MDDIGFVILDIVICNFFHLLNFLFSQLLSFSPGPVIHPQKFLIWGKYFLRVHRVTSWLI
jgi:hypothetical protein